MIGKKRSAERGLGERPRKLLRQVGSGSSVTEGHVMGLPSAWNWTACRFYEASPSDVAAFDWSGLTGALLDEGFDEIRGRYEDDDYVFVPQAEWRVHLSRHVILREIAHTLDLKVHGFGFTCHDSGLQVAWLDTDVPPSETGGLRGRKKFDSDAFMLRVDAIEDVSARAISWLMKECCVKVVDMNYDKMKELQSKVAAMDELVTVYADKIIDVKEKGENLRTCFKNVVTDAQNVLRKYADVVPVGHAPTTRLEQLVCELASLIGNAAGMVAAPPDMV